MPRTSNKHTEGTISVFVTEKTGQKINPLSYVDTAAEEVA